MTTCHVHRSLLIFIFFLYIHRLLLLFFFFFNDTATTEIYTLSLHDALPIFRPRAATRAGTAPAADCCYGRRIIDRKSTRLNSSHDQISYAVFCLKKKKKKKTKDSKKDDIPKRKSDRLPDVVRRQCCEHHRV